MSTEFDTMVHSLRNGGLEVDARQVVVWETPKIVLVDRQPYPELIAWVPVPLVCQHPSLMVRVSSLAASVRAQAMDSRALTSAIFTGEGCVFSRFVCPNTDATEAVQGLLQLTRDALGIVREFSDTYLGDLDELRAAMTLQADTEVDGEREPEDNS
jgi:hypothetical protein